MIKGNMMLLAGVLSWMAVIWPGQRPALAGDVEKKIETPVHQALQIEQKTQAGQATWRAEKELKIRRFEQLEKDLAALETQAETLAAVKAALTAKTDQKERQLSDIARIENEISPFLDQLLSRIREIRDKDLPFLEEERSKRISTLEALARDPSAPVSEKYRKLMEALMVEAEYGQTVDVYQQTIDLSGEPTLVNIFRLGRLRLFYQTLDRQQCGFYNTAQKGWTPLDRQHVKSLQAAVDMAAKRKPVELTDLPVGRLVIQ